MEHSGGNFAVGRDKHEHRRHIRVNHTRALGDPADRTFLAPDGKFHGDLFLFRVRGHNAFRGGFAVVSKPFHERGDTVLNRRDIEGLTDHPRRSHDDIRSRNAELFGKELRGKLRDLDPVRVAGVRVARIANDRLRVAVRDMVFRDRQRRALDFIRRIYGRASRFRLRIDKREVLFRPILTDSRVHAACGEAFRGANAAFDNFHKV